jgi:hypothetical protein
MELYLCIFIVFLFSVLIMLHIWLSLFIFISKSQMYNVAFLLKARTVKPAETAVATERLCKHARC